LKDPGVEIYGAGRPLPHVEIPPQPMEIVLILRYHAPI
jgi:hypothetical protein